MPTIYKRKGNVERQKWSLDALKNAVAAIQNDHLGVNQAAKMYGIPKTTLKRRLKKNDLQSKSKTNYVFYILDNCTNFNLFQNKVRHQFLVKKMRKK